MAQIGGFDVGVELGHGGMGRVFRARDPRLGRDVAIKLLHEHGKGEPERLRRFEQEARAAAALSHPNVVAVHEIGTHEGAPFIVTELLEGETLRARLAGGALPWRKAVELGVQIAAGLAAAHARGIVHRDLKPDNVFITSEGRAKILDFGVARLAGEAAQGEESTLAATESGAVLGTAGYMAPEQVRGRTVDHRADIFAFGAVLHEMLSGKRAFDGATHVERGYAILTHEPPELPPSVPPAVAAIARRCLEKQPDERFQSARDVGFALQAVADGSAPREAAVEPPRRRRSWLVAVPFAFAAVAAGGYLAAPREPGVSLPSFKPLTFRRGVIHNARFAGDGIAYSAAWDGGAMAVYSQPAGHPEARLLYGDGARLLDVAASGDVLLRAGDALARGSLAGAAPRPLAEDVLGADWFPDGKRQAVVRRVGGKLVVEFPEGRKVVDSDQYVRAPRVSPDGTAVAVPRWSNGRDELVVADGKSEPRILVPRERFERIERVAWSPSGDEVWFSAAELGHRRKLHAVHRDGGDVRELFRAPIALDLEDVAADGRALVIATTYTVRSFARRRGEERDREITWLDATENMDLTADGAMLLFLETGDARGPREPQAFVRRLDGSPPVKLIEGWASAVAPDGSRVLAIDPEAIAPERMLLVPTGAGPTTPLPTGSLTVFHGGSFFHDGRRVLLVGRERIDAPRRLYVQDLGGGPPREVTPAGVNLWDSTSPVAPDGTRFFAFDEEAQQHRIFAVGSDPPAPGAEIAGMGARERPIRWIQDGRLIVVHEKGNVTSVHALDLATGGRELLHTIEVDPIGLAAPPRVILSADGSTLVYRYMTHLSTLFLVEGLR
jgi:hypothetical protein